MNLYQKIFISVPKIFISVPKIIKTVPKIFKSGVITTNFDQLLEYMTDAYTKRVRFMDHTHTKKLVGRENVLEEFLVNIISPQSDKTDDNGATH